MTDIKRKKVKYRWSARKFIKHVFVFTLVLGVSIILICTTVNASFFPSTSRQSSLTVLQGDTLWTIAKRLDPFSDPRIIIDKIKEQNHLFTSSIAIGQKLKFVKD